TNPVANIGLTLRSGSGTGLVGDVSIAGVTFSNVNATSNFVVQANGNVTLSPVLTSYTVTASGTMSITSTTGTITTPTGAQLVAGTLTLTAPGGLGAGDDPSHFIHTKVDSLSTDSSGGGGAQFITQQTKGLTALNLN